MLKGDWKFKKVNSFAFYTQKRRFIRFISSKQLAFHVTKLKLKYRSVNWMLFLIKEFLNLYNKRTFTKINNTIPFHEKYLECTYCRGQVLLLRKAVKWLLENVIPTKVILIAKRTNVCSLMKNSQTWWTSCKYSAYRKHLSFFLSHLLCL